MSSSKIRFIAMMPFLIDRGGHDCVYNLYVKEAVDSLKIEYRGYISSDCALLDIPSEWNKWFANAQSSLGYWERLKRRYRDYIRILKNHSDSKSRVFFIEHFYKLDMFAFFLAFMFKAKSTDRLWIFFRESLPANKLHPYRFLSKVLYSRFKHRLVFLTDSAKIQNTFRGLPFTPMVWPIPHVRHVAQEVEKATGSILCWWPGSPRLNKGWEYIRKLTTLRDAYAKHFTLRAAKSSALISDNDLSIELIQDHLSDEDYTKRLGECQVVLLPYDPLQYAASTSGIFVEAVVAHRIPLVKDGSWLADELKHYDLHELILDWEQSDFFAHVFALIKNEKMLNKLSFMQHAYAKFHSMETFQLQIAKLLESSSKNPTCPLSCQRAERNKQDTR